MLRLHLKPRPAKPALCISICACALAAACAADPPAPPVAAGLRQVSSTHLTLLTDLPSSAEVDGLPRLFDAAVPQWCRYFGVDPASVANWRMRGCLMRSPQRFRAAGLLPADAPDFPNGYTRGEWLWLHEQTSPYYRRHLLLHEGTHAFMFTHTGGGGPPWYAEGMAELLATHRLVDGQLALNVFPAARDQAPKWGRIEIVQAAVAQRRPLSLPQVLAFSDRAHLENEPYGWCWAAAAFFEHQPRYQARFRALPPLASQAEFNDRFQQALGDDWPRVTEDWQLYVANLDYGYDFARMQVDYDAPAAALPADGAQVTIAADRGWQPSGLRLEAGRTYRLRACGRYQVAAQPRPWMCEPGGVTIRYVGGRPLGVLLAAVRPLDPPPDSVSGLARPLAVGVERSISFDHSGALYLRVNDSAGSLADNAGTLEVLIEAQ